MSHDTGRPSAPQDTPAPADAPQTKSIIAPSSPPGEQTHHKPLVAAIGTTAMMVIGEIANQKYGTYVPDWLLLLSCLFTLYLWSYWLWTHEKIKRQRRLVYTNPRMSFAVMVVACAVIGGGVGALLWWGARRQPAAAAQPAATPQPAPTTQPQPAALSGYIRIARVQLNRTALPRRVHLQYVNSGPVPIQKHAVAGKVFIRNLDTLSDQSAVDALFKDFVEELGKIEQIRWSPTLGPGEGGSTTVYAYELTYVPSDSPELLNGEKMVFIVGAARFSDSAGQHRKAFCYVLAPALRPFMQGVVDPWNNWKSCNLSNAAEWEAKADEDKG